jgi:NADPH:quinone reductase-like Zn-dependent oxidoreductase
METNICVEITNGECRMSERPIPVPSAKQVLIKIKVVKVNETDVLMADGALKSSKDPIIPGQEFCGIVTQTGSEVDAARLRVGDKVVVEPRRYCNQ